MILLIVVVTIVTFAFALVFAGILSREKIRGQNFFRIIFYIPNILSVVVIAGIFSAIYKPENGMLNSIIGLFHKMENPILWKGESLVIVSLIIAMIWQAIGYYMVMYMASMASVPKSLYESAGLDGAGRLVQFFQITIPLIWTNMDKHEMYCAGHMIEAGVAYYKATGKRKLLDVCIRMTDHMMSIFGPGKRDWVPGHEEIELALVKLYQTTGEQKYLDFADWLIEERGHGHGSKGGEGEWDPFYYQDDKPVREMSDIAGHAVRCMYLYCGMADVAALKQDSGYIESLNRLWDDVVLRNMYITGGIGSSRHNEGFTEDYDLPNLDAYCETCASVGMVLWNQRMNQFTGDSKYIDVLERSMYNGALAGISLEGDRFFYVNPLESKGDHHRQAWYGCACCPSQISRFLPSIGNYIYGTSNEAIWVNLYIGNSTEINTDNTNVTLRQETNYPWDGTVKLTVTPSNPLKKEIRLRIPSWCEQYTLSVNGQLVKAPTEKGYAVLNKEWKQGDVISLSMEMPVKLMTADPRVKQNIGKRAIQRGPLVYCMEEVDNPQDFDNLKIAANTSFNAQFNPKLLNGITTIKATTNELAITLIPYYTWDNRKAGKMKVWIDYNE